MARKFGFYFYDSSERANVFIDAMMQVAGTGKGINLKSGD